MVYNLIRLKRAYEPAGDDGGCRILVERLWPRGVRKDDADFEAWLKDVARGAELIKWYAHDIYKWQNPFQLSTRTKVFPVPSALATRASRVCHFTGFEGR